jgi:hypothetical protein
MKRTNLAAAGLLTALAAALTACGGSDDAGSVTPFSLSNDSLNLKQADPTAPANTCPSGYVGTVFVYGGAAPYQLDNTAPDAVVLNPTNEVAHPGDSFTVSATGFCGTFTIVVNDKLGKQVKLKVTNSPA